MTTPQDLAPTDSVVWLRNKYKRHGELEDKLAADEIEASRTRIASLEAEVALLRVDAERLDYIQRNARCDPKMDGQHVWWPTTFNHRLTGSTLRAAIDAARKESHD